MSPLALDILVWYSTRAAAAGSFENFDMQPQQEIITYFVAQGILTPDIDVPDFYRPTDKGRAWLDMILDTPMPVQQWLDPRTHPPA